MLSNSQFIKSLCLSDIFISPENLIKFDLIPKLDKKVIYLLENVIPKLLDSEKINDFLQDILDYYDNIMLNSDIANSYITDFIKNFSINTYTNKIDYPKKLFIRFNWMIEDGHFTLPFGKIYGSFVCANSKLTSLENGPIEVDGNYLCNRCELTTLKGAPKKIGKDFDCANNYKLSSLEYGPLDVGQNFICSACALTSLNGCPKIIHGSFSCSSNNKLTTLENGPIYVEKNYYCSCCSLISLKGSPIKINENFDCSFNFNLKSLEDGPKEVVKIYMHDNCAL